MRADCEGGAYDAVRHLVGLGHRDIAVLAHSQHLLNIAERIAGCRRALVEAGLFGRERIVHGGHDLESLREATEKELTPREADGDFALTNVCALAAIKAARGLGLGIPGDVSIVGFDDLDWMVALRPYLTTVAQPVDEFAESAWALLMRRMGGDADSPAERILLPCTLKIRESTGPARSEVPALAASRT